MSKLVLPTAVFVPFEWKNGDWTKRNDIPRFVEPQECLRYFTCHPELAARGVQIDFQEYSEKWAIDEYCIGVGTSKILL